MITKGTRVVGVLDGEKLIVASPLLLKWFKEGVPSLKPSLRRGAIYENVQTVAPSSDLFGLALLDALETYDLDLVPVEENLAKAGPPVTNVGGGQTASGIGGGANIQMQLPEKPHNPHDAAGVRDYLIGMKDSGNVTVTRDPTIYVLDSAIEWLYPIADAYGNVKNIITPDETVSRAEENKAMITRTSKQDRDVPGNSGETSQVSGQWHPVQREGAARYPDGDDSGRMLKTPKDPS